MSSSSTSFASLSYTGVVFAGGKSSRMGRNKALLRVADVPLWKRQCDLLAAAGAAPCLLSLRAEDAWLPPEISRVTDSGEKGPLGGLLAALEGCTSTHLIALAVDLPQMEVAWFERLQTRCVRGRGAVGHNLAAGAFEPLAAIYPRELQPLVGEAAAAGTYCLQSLLARAVSAGLLHVETIAPREISWFTNWNNPSDVVET